MVSQSKKIGALAICVLIISSQRTNADPPVVGWRERSVQDHLARIERDDATFNAFLEVSTEVVATARARDNAFGDRRTGPLDGVVVAVKANLDMTDLGTTAGSNRLSGPARIDATVVRRLRDAGALIIGSTNMDTWARGTRTVSEVGGSTGNAYAPDRSPLGSSGGSAVAVATGMADVALGSDTCGSVRLPAAANGLYGLRPTSELVSRAGLVPLSPTQDVVGPIASTPEAIALVLQAMIGADLRDPSALRSAPVDPSPRSWRIGILRAYGVPDAATLQRLRAGGAELVELAAPKLGSASVIEDEATPSREAYIAHRLAGAPDGPQPWLTGPLSVNDADGYAIRLKAHVRLAAALTRFMDQNRLDAIAYPTTPYAPGRRGEVQKTANCWIAATSGLPALAVPGAIRSGNVPVIGVDLLGRRFSEPTLLSLASGRHRVLPAAAS